MASFLEDITPFYGTGERNGKGQTLEEFLEEYDPYRYKNPCCTTDTVVFSYKEEQALKEGRLKVLLVKRGNHPSIGCWALPGGFVNLRENLEDTARRELQEETGVSGLPVEQFACYGDYQRDPRARIITSAYLSIVKESDVSVEAGEKILEDGTKEEELITDAIDIAASYNHTLILRTNGTVWSAGYNQYGELGTGDTEERKRTVCSNEEAYQVYV